MKPNTHKYCILILSCACLALGFSSCKKNNDTKINNNVAILPSNTPLKGVNITTEKAIHIEPREIKINTDKIGAACRTHTDCEAGQACIQKTCRSMDHVACSADLDCPDYEKCVDGKCAMCATDADCRAGFICSYAGVCLPNQMNLIECTQASECQAGEVCVDGKCAGFCGDEKECMSQFLPYASPVCNRSTSVLTGICTDMRACNTNDDCHSGYTCYMKRCERILCKADADCGEGHACHDGFCYALRCTKDSDCENGNVCRQNECWSACQTDDDCWGSGTCTDGACRVECTAEKCKESRNGNACINNRCETCAVDTDCGEGKYCLVKENIDVNASETKGEYKFGQFFPANNIFYSKNISTQCVECLTDENCSNGLHCIDYQCKAYECNEDKECGDGKFCNSSHKCVALGKTCKTSTEIPKDDGNFEINIDVKISGDTPNVKVNDGIDPSEECDAGQICADGICMSKSWQPECKIDSDCRALSERAICNPIPTWVGSEGFKHSFKHFCAISCTTDAECEPFGKYMGTCNNGICTMGNERPYCKTTADCKDGKVCSPLYGECIDDPSKRTERNTAENHHANNLDSAISNYMTRSATLACWRDSDCDNTTCTGTGTCSCVDDIQCGTGRACKAVKGCVCVTDEGCPQGFSCKNEDCLCHTDEACGNGKLCSEEGQCIEDTHPIENYLHGQKYETGNEAAIDVQKAVKFYQTALDNGSLSAMVALGRLYQDGNGVTKDEKLGKALIDIAIKLYDDRDATVPHDAPKLLEKYNQIEDKTYWGADKEIAMLYLEGKYLPQNEEKAISMLGSGFDVNYKLAKYYETKGNLEKARYYYTKCSAYGVSPESRSFSKRLDVSHKLLEMAEKNLGISKELCENNSEPNVRVFCSEYKFLGEHAKDAKAAYEYAAMCREDICWGCFNDDTKLFQFAVESGIVSQSCQENEANCPSSQWKQKGLRDRACYDLRIDEAEEETEEETEEEEM